MNGYVVIAAWQLYLIVGLIAGLGVAGFIIALVQRRRRPKGDLLEHQSLIGM